MILVKENPKNGNGFDTLHTVDGWKIAFITYSTQYGEPEIVKRHTKTDEVFILVKGEATLFACEDSDSLEKTPLEKEKVYVVQKNTWHHLKVSKDALLIVVENGDTSKENTESKEMKRGKQNDNGCYN